MSRKSVSLSIGLFLVFFLVANAFAQGKAAKSDSNKPVAVVKDMTVNLGEVLEGVDMDYAFVIKNTGTADLQILNVKPT